MARKTKAEAAVTREQLLDAAERVFSEQGVASATLGEVASAAGVTRGAVYWHFRDKADLLAALCERVTLPMHAIFEDREGRGAVDPLGVLRANAVGALTLLARDPHTQAVFRMAFQACGSGDDLAPLATAREQERCGCLERSAALLERAIALGQLPADTDAGLVAHALHAYITGLMQSWVHAPDAWDLAGAAPALVDSVITGFVEAPPRRAAAAVANLHTAD
ncbi:MAG TPA: TetR family transcriptional regulator [Casimicrobiaceae bacterium]|jgi:TetR/AcrR family acrAB operon transcriptional repressor